MSYNYDRIIIDGNNFLFRAFFINRPEKLVRGINVSPIHQFLSMLKSTVSTFKAKEVVFTWDKKLNATRRNFRRDLVPYKEQRVETEQTTKLFSTISHIEKFINALGIKTIYPMDMEADDVICYLTKNCDKRTVVISSDHDLLQLVNEYTHIYLPSKDKIVTLDNFEEFGKVKTPNIFVLYKSILGDKSDNISGLEKYGKVKAKKLTEIITEDGSSDFSKADLSSEQIEIINRNLTVMDLNYTQQIYPEEYKSYKKQEDEFSLEFNSEELRDLFREYELNSFLNSFGEWNRLFNNNKDCNDLLSFISM